MVKIANTTAKAAPHPQTEHTKNNCHYAHDGLPRRLDVRPTHWREWPSES